MDPVSPLPAIACLLVAMATAFLLMKQFGAPPHQGRFVSIDGLRGYLAFFVFLHHASIWYFYLRTGRWELPPSNLYTQFGHSSVFLFFMITGFLFFSKLIDGRTNNIDWGKLFIARLLRLVPLYLFFVFILFLLVAYLSKGNLNVPILRLLKDMASWVSFTLFNTPNLNGIGGVVLLSVAGATWSLPYEWRFYLLLPLLALTVKAIPPFPYIALSVASIVVLAIWGPQIRLFFIIPFFSGIIASLLARSDLFCQFATRRLSSYISLGCLAITIAAYPSALNFVPLFLLTVAFALIACGNSMFGLLSSPASRTLGEMAYSIYLLHGITLFVTFNFILGKDAFVNLSPITYWLYVIGLTPILIFICFTTFRLIESPAMRNTSRLTVWLRSHGNLHSKENQEN